MTTATTRRREVSTRHPCPVCEAVRGCSREAGVEGDGLIFCRKRSGQQAGYVYLGQCADGQWSMYRAESDPVIIERQRQRDHERNGHHRPAPSPTPSMWDTRAREYADGAEQHRHELMRSLGLPEATGAALPLIGWREDEGCWTLPEMDEAGRVIGIMRWYTDGRKQAQAGSARGIILPAGWREREGPIYLVEGHSDTLALTALGLSAVGRPSNTGGVGLLAQLLADVPAERQIVVVGEWDCKPDGQFPGRDGAIMTATRLAADLDRPVMWAMPPDQIKDVRAWVRAQNLDATCSDDWAEAGEALSTALIEQARSPAGYAVDPSIGADDGSSDPPAIDFGLLDLRTLARTDCRFSWLAHRVLVQHQPCVIGAPKKSLKTSVGIDLAVSLATGTAFLGEFHVEQPIRVGMLSGESGVAAIKSTALRVCAARGVDPDAIEDVLFGFRLPHLSDPEHIAALRQMVAQQALDALIIDPLYLSALPGGKDGPSASNLYEMGPLLLSVAESCLASGCTPLLIHHFKLGRQDPYGEPQLDDLAFAGIQEFARQWILLGRREKYVPGTGQHRLWLSVGGSAGHSGLWALDVDEGVMGDDFGGRTWDVSVSSPHEALESRRQERDTAKAVATNKRQQDDDAILMQTLDTLDPAGQGVPLSRIEDESGLTRERVRRSIARLRRSGLLAEMTVTVTIGSGAKRDVQGVRRTPSTADHL